MHKRMCIRMTHKTIITKYNTDFTNHTHYLYQTEFNFVAIKKVQA